MNIRLRIFLISTLCLVTIGLQANNTTNRVLPSDSTFYYPSIDSSHTATFPDGEESTSAFQSLVDELSNLGGGILTISRGSYTLDQIKLKSNVHIRVEEEVVFHTSPQGALFSVGMDAAAGLVNNWSLQSTTGKKFTFDLSDFEPTESIRIFQISQVSNFRIGDFSVIDNNTKFNTITTSATGEDGMLYYPQRGIIENIDVTMAHYGYGLIQCQIGRKLLFRNLDSEGGVTLRLESGLKTLADRLDPEAIINEVYGRNISCINGASAVMLSPHTVTQGWVDVRNISGESCEGVVATSAGFLSAKKEQTIENGYTKGSFSEESVISNVTAIFGTNAQVRTTRLRFVPCALRAYISADKNPDEESYTSPALAPVYDLAMNNYGESGTYKVTIENITPIGFSEEYRADGFITDAGDNDFEGCNSSAFLPSDDRNTPNPLQNSFKAIPLNLNNKTASTNFNVSQTTDCQFINVEYRSTSRISIYNTLGIVVKNTLLHQGKTLVNVSDLPQGLYIVKVLGAYPQSSKSIILH